MRKFVIGAGILLLVTTTLFAGNAFGQAIGSITGVVQDVTQARIPGVSVTATNTATGVKTPTITNESGAYNLPSLAVGPYTLEATLPGFRNARVANIDVRNNETLRYDLTMEVAAVGTEVEVILDARDVLAVSSASVGEALTQTQVSALPLVGGDVLDLVSILPGFRAGTGGNGNNNDTFAGIESSQINTVRDGLSVSDGRFQNGVFGTTMINPDMVGEIRLILTPVDAELGRGNGQVQITTRSGTNRYSGTAVWSIRNSGLNANTWSNNNDIDPETGAWSPTTPDWENHHQITASFGGPIIRNKTFFFGLFDRNFVRTRSIVDGLVLTDTARQGIFRYFSGWTPDDADATPGTSSYPAVDFLGNPVAPPINQNGTPYSGGLVCFSVFGTQKVNPSTFQMSPFTQADCDGGTAVFPANNAASWDAGRPAADTTGFMMKFLADMPSTNNFQGGDGLNTANHRWLRTAIDNGINSAAAYGAASDIERKQFNFKIDHNFNDNHKANFGMTFERDAEGTNFSDWPGMVQGLTRRAPWILTSSVTSTLSPTMINEARFGVRYNVLNEFEPWEHPNSEIAERAQQYFIPGSNGYSAVFNPAMFSGGNSPYANGDYNGNKSPLYSFGDTLSWTRGTHAFRFGGEVRLTRTTGYNGIPARPRPVLTGGNGENTATLIRPSTSTADGQPGLITSGTQQNPSAQTNARNLLYFLSGSIDQGSQLYWIDGADDVANGTWETFQTLERKYRDQILNEMSFFAKDDWKVSPSLTLNLGVRWEWYGVPYIGSGFTTTTPGQGRGLFGAGRTGLGDADPFDSWLLRASDIYLQSYGTTGSLECTTGVASGVAGIPDSNCDPSLVTGVEFVGPNSPNPDKLVYRNDMNNFGPAVGFAWQLPFGRPGQTTMRGGYQVTFGGSGRNGIQSDSYLGGAPGATSNATIDFAGMGNPYLDLTDVPSLVPLTPRNPAVPGGTLGSVFSHAGQFTAFDPNYTTPYIQNFTLSLTHQLNRNMTIDLRYAGTQGKKLNGSIRPNITNVYYNKELLDAIETVRLGGEAALFDQLFAGLNLNTGTAGWGPIGTCATQPVGSTVPGLGQDGCAAGQVLQTGSRHLRRRLDTELAEGDYVAIATFINENAGGNPTSRLLNFNSALTNVGGRILRNGCDRMAGGTMTVGTTTVSVAPSTTVGPAIATPLRCFPENYIVANPQFGDRTSGAFEASPTYNTNTGGSNYHSMQAQFSLRPTGGMSFQSTYTWSKTMELPDSNWTDPLNRNADYRLATSHVPHEFRMNGTFQLPMGPNQLLLGNSSGTLARIIEGWKLSWTYNLFSGVARTIGAEDMMYDNGTPDVVGPWNERGGTILWGQDVGGQNLGGSYFGPVGTYQVVPDPQCAVGGPLDYTDGMGTNIRSECGLNAIADSSGRIVLQNPMPGKRGTLGQQTITAPGTWRLDGSLSKTFQISESKQIQLRFDATNVLNHPDPFVATGNNIGPVLDINNDSFGTIPTKGNQRREFQGQLRFLF
jgi:hypothetical protein